ncbi:MAG: sigma-70 family RNA polymerase sigma factor [Planctomycetaceae bacterium]|nr:sigma-70 family RNA polymerase sigma factor [Planctomycetaceae bacterium]
MDGGSKLDVPMRAAGSAAAVKTGELFDALSEPQTAVLHARFGPGLASRLAEVERELAGEDLSGLLRVLADRTRDGDSLRDGLSTQLMELYRVHQARSCFALLYELNRSQLLLQVAQRLRRYSSRSDPNDLLQEVFFNVYRYPTRFDSTRDDAFRVWTATIVRNTVLKHLRSLGKSGRVEVPFEDLSEHPETRSGEPLGGVIERESQGECRRVYLYHLYLYLEFFKQLSEREQRALELVEVQGVSYREAADDLQIRLENLKMVVFRARRKIYKAMRRVYDGLAPELRPARDVAGRRAAVAVADGVTGGGTGASDAVDEQGDCDGAEGSRASADETQRSAARRGAERGAGPQGTSR